MSITVGDRKVMMTGHGRTREANNREIYKTRDTVMTKTKKGRSRKRNKQYNPNCSCEVVLSYTNTKRPSKYTSSFPLAYDDVGVPGGFVVDNLAG